MSLREMLEKWPHDRLVKELYATAKRNAQLEDEAQHLRHEVFWLRAEIQTDLEQRLLHIADQERRDLREATSLRLLEP